MTTADRSESGASAVIVAIVLLLLFGAGALAIDLGAVWDTKRDLLVDTDAAALAAARVAADEGCTTVAEDAAVDFLSANLGRTVTSDDIHYTCDTEADLTTPNTVYVEFTDQAQQALSQALGSDDLDVFASSTAEFNGFQAGDLRPISSCVASPEIQQAISDPDTLPVTYYVSMERIWKGSSTCVDGDNPPSGDWGWVCFDGNCGNSPHDTGIRGMLENGYQGFIDLGQSPPDEWDDAGSDEDCGSGEDPPWCESANGGKGGATDVINDNMLGQTFSILVHDRVDNTNGGSFHPYAYAYVHLTGWCKDKNNARNVDLYPPDGSEITQTECHDNGTGSGDWVFKLQLLGVGQGGEPQDFFNPVEPRVEQCGVDNDPGSEANRCDRVFAD